MKKFLLSLATAALCGSAMATTVTFDFATNAYGLPNDGDTYVTLPATITQDDVTVVLEGNENAWRYWSDGLRAYSKNAPSFTVSMRGEKVKKITWEGKSGFSLSTSEGGDVVNDWSGDAESVTLYYVGTKNVALTSLSVTYGDVSADQPDQPDQPGDDGDSYSLDAKNATDIEGDFVEETLKDDGSLQAAPHYQPLESLVIDGFTFTFSSTNENAGSQPAYYMTPSTNANTAPTVRIYNGTSMTVTAPEGVEMTKVAFTGSNLGNNAAFTVDNGQWVSANNAEWYGKSNSFTVTANASWRFTALTVYTGEVEAPEQPEQPTGVITVAEALAQIEAGYTGVAQVKGYITAIEEVSTQYGNATYDISDDINGSNALKVYRGYYLNGDKFTSEDQIKVGDLVVVEGNLKMFYETPEVDTGSKILSIDGSGETPEQPDQPDQPGQPEQPEGETVTFDFTDPAGLGINVGDATEFDLTGVTLTNGPVEMLCECEEDAKTAIRLFSSNGNWTFRFYSATSFTVSVDAEYVLTGIEFDGTNLGTDWSYSNGSLSGNTWTPSSTTNAVTIGKTATGNNPAIKTMTVYYSKTSGVEAIEAEGEAVYYNLQGVRVANPERGIFVKVQNGKAVKVVK